MRRILGCAMLALALSGCQYYRVTDPSSGRTYYTDNWHMGRYFNGALAFTDVTTGGAMASVKVAVDGGELTSAITKDAVTDLALTTGTPVVALIKSTEISLATA